jgi:blue copper oxidase
MRRRTLLKAGAGLVATAGGVAASGLGLLYATADVQTAGRIPFTNRLALPPLARSGRDDRGRTVFDLHARPARHGFRSGVPTPTWSFDGSYLGPTLRARRGETVVVNVHNELPEATTVHWHGMHLPAAMDGGPHQPVPPGSTWSPSWRIDQPAATLWYHPHPHKQTARHVYRGLAGLFLVDEDLCGPSGLPCRYGVDDVPLIVQDLKLAGDNRLGENNPGKVHGTVCVNGTLAPYLPVSTERIRLRLLNASGGRVYRLRLSDGRPFDLIGTDGGLLAAPFPASSVQLSPGERAEVVVTMRPGERVVLRSDPPELGGNFFSDRFAGGDDTLDVLELRAAATLEPSPPLPRELAPPARLDTSVVAATRRFELALPRINGQSMDMSRIDAVARLGSTEIWEVVNIDGQPHNFHIHDVQFRVQTVDGAPPPPELSGWKDTIYTPPKRVFRLALRFTDYADPQTPYMFHCHLLQHEDLGMMGQFLVLDTGQRPGTPSGHRHHN